MHSLHLHTVRVLKRFSFPPKISDYRFRLVSDCPRVPLPTHTRDKSLFYPHGHKRSLPIQKEGVVLRDPSPDLRGIPARFFFGGGKRKHWVLPRTTQTMMMTTTTTTMSFHICRFGRDDGFSFSPQFAAVSFPVCVLVCLRLCVCVEVLTVCMSVCEGVWGGGIKKFTCLRCCLPQTAANFYALPTFFFFLFFYIHLQTEPNPLPSYQPTYLPLFWLLLYFISSSLSGFVFFLSFWRV